MTQESQGLYRSGKYLVIDRKKHQFPLRCFWSDDSVRAVDTKVSVSWVPPAMDHSRRNEVAVAVNAAYQLAQRQTVPMVIPVCDKCNATRRSIAKTALIIGIVSLVLSIGTWGYIATLTDPAIPPARIMAITGFTCVVSLATLLGFTFAFGLYCLPRGYVARHIDADHIWLNEISPSFLKTLPEWHGKSVEEIQAAAGL